MTTLLKAVQQALEALVSQFDGRADAIDILSAALAQQAEPGEPVGTVRVDAGEVHIIPAIRDADRSALKDGQAVYAAPPQRKPLTEDEIRQIGETYTDEVWRDDGWSIDFARAVEAKHEIKAD